MCSYPSADPRQVEARKQVERPLSTDSGLHYDRWRTGDGCLHVTNDLRFRSEWVRTHCVEGTVRVICSDPSQCPALAGQRQRIEAEQIADPRHLAPDGQGFLLENHLCTAPAGNLVTDGHDATTGRVVQGPYRRATVQQSLYQTSQRRTIGS